MPLRDPVPEDVCQCGYKRSRHDEDASFECPLGRFRYSHGLSGEALRMERYFDENENTHRTRLVVDERRVPLVRFTIETGPL